MGRFDEFACVIQILKDKSLTTVLKINYTCMYKITFVTKVSEVKVSSKLFLLSNHLQSI